MSEEKNIDNSAEGQGIKAAKKAAKKEAKAAKKAEHKKSNEQSGENQPHESSGIFFMHTYFNI